MEIEFVKNCLYSQSESLGPDLIVSFNRYFPENSIELYSVIENFIKS